MPSLLGLRVLRMKGRREVQAYGCYISYYYLKCVINYDVDIINKNVNKFQVICETINRKLESKTY